MRFALQAIFVVVATVSFTVATIQAPDPLPFAVLGCLAVVGLVALEWKRPQRWLAARVPFFEPGITKLGRVIDNGTRLRVRMQQQGMDASDDVEPAWQALFDEWYAEASRVVRNVAPDWHPYLQAPYVMLHRIDGIPRWLGSIAGALDERIRRLISIQEKF
jgi:hypothetical protein